MQFSVLGPLEVRSGDASLPLGGRRQRSVLALLLLDRGRPVDADRMVSEIWGDPSPDGARDSLYTYVSNLRRILGRHRILRTDAGYRFVASAEDVVDADEVDTVLTEAHRITRSDPNAAIELIEDSLSAWRGRPFEGFENLPSVSPEASRLEELRLRALEDRIAAELDRGATPEVGAVEMLTAEHPYRERLWELLARSLYRSGRQTEALRALNRLRRMLADDLGLEPSPAITRLEERILLQDPSLDADATGPTNLPTPVSSFIGRSEDAGRLERLIGDHRLVTVTGPGGAGKTRLAVEVAARVAGRFPDGVWFVDLAQVNGPEEVERSVAASLGASGPPGGAVADVVAGRLAGKTELLVLDNCEHVADGVGRLALRLLTGAGDVRIMVTSRRPLGLAEEVLAPLEGLGTGTPDVADGTPTARDAERLFEARAAAVQPDFALTEANLADVTSICRHLDGMPLAIELAAARIDTMSPTEIERRLSDRFRLLGAGDADRPTHRSLRASLDWSVDLLGAEHRQAFIGLGAFEGPFTARAATAVLDASSEMDALEVLRHLVGTSLVQTMPGTVTRYRLLETTRMYARSRLGEVGLWDVVAQRHDDHFAARCRELRDPFFGIGRSEACRSIEAEMVDFEAAFDRITDRDVDAALAMAWSLGHVWTYSGRLGSGIERIERVLAIAHRGDPRDRADALAVGSFLLMYVTRYEQAIAWADDAIGIYRTIGDERGLAYALARRGHLAFSVGDVPTALTLLEESLDTCERIGYRDGTAWPLTLLGQARLWGGDESDEVRRMLEDGRRSFIAVGDTYGQMHANMFIPNVGDQPVDVKLRYARESVELSNRPDADPLTRAVALHNLAFSHWSAGERERAFGENRLAARSALETGATISSGMAFLQAGLFEALAGDPERAAVLYGAGDSHFVMTKAPFYERQLHPGIDAAVSALGEDRYRQLSRDGAAMSIEDATDFLLQLE